MNLDLTQRAALVCGSSQGIGLAAAIELARLGAHVTLLARNRENLQLALQKLPNTLGQHHQILVADFQKPQEVATVVDHWLADGNAPVILVNNSGGPPPGPIRSAQISEFRAAFESHLIINHVLVERLLPVMIKQAYGRIINIISTSVKQPLHGLGVSNTIRAAVANWAKTLANEVASYGITVNNVLPGATRTSRLESILEATAAKQQITVREAEDRMLESIPARRFGEPHEIGAAIAFLASPAAAYITGVNVPIDGGRTQCL